MKEEVVRFLLAEQGRENELQTHLVLQCAPLLKGMKAAAVLTIREKWCESMDRAVAETGLEYWPLAEMQGREVVLFFRRKALAAHLNQEAVRDFLRGYGYTVFAVDAVLRRLAKRMRGCREKGKEFPHEMGVLLEYPLEDVTEYIRRKGRDSLLSGYWKVYGNPGRAQLRFFLYDWARTSAVNEFLAGKALHKISFAI